jgi:hypothetical protein
LDSKVYHRYINLTFKTLTLIPFLTPNPNPNPTPNTQHPHPKSKPKLKPKLKPKPNPNPNPNPNPIPNPNPRQEMATQDKTSQVRTKQDVDEKTNINTST